MSVVNLPLLIGPVFGPVIGGLLVDSVGWRAIFYVNIPICAAVLLFAFRVIPRSAPEPGRRLDVRGLLLLSPGLTLLVYALSQAGGGGGAGALLTLVSLVAGLVLIGTFAAHALRLGGEKALIDMSLFTRRAFAAPAAIAFLFAFMMQSALVLYPLYWQIVRDASPLQAGLLIGPQGVGSLITILFIGRLSDRYGAARLAPIGLVLLTIGTVAWAQADADTSYALLVGATFLRGFGISFLGTPAYAAAYQALSASEAPRGTTAYNIVQRCGSAFGIATVVVVLQHQLGRADGGGDAFGPSFTVLVVVTVLTLLPALLLPWRGAKA
jgi:MFS family permease